MHSAHEAGGSSQAPSYARSNLRSPLSGKSVVEFLADREGLAGRARERFKCLLIAYGGFQNISKAKGVRFPILASLLLGLIGLYIERPRQWNDYLVWVEYGFLSAVLIWFHGEENCAPRVDRETDWEAYCLFLRPIILRDHPGLLDRNAREPRQRIKQSSLHPAPTFQGLVHQRGPNFWRAALFGLWGGTGALLAVDGTIAAIRLIWALAFPAAGLILGLTGWLMWCRLAYVIARSESRLNEQ